jgi:hypothetical protein
MVNCTIRPQYYNNVLIVAYAERKQPTDDLKLMIYHSGSTSKEVVDH